MSDSNETAMALAKRAEELVQAYRDHAVISHYLRDSLPLVPEMAQAIRALCGEVERLHGHLKVDNDYAEVLTQERDDARAALAAAEAEVRERKAQLMDHGYETGEKLAAKDAEIAHLRLGVDVYKDCYRLDVTAQYRTECVDAWEAADKARGEQV